MGGATAEVGLVHVTLGSRERERAIEAFVAAWERFTPLDLEMLSAICRIKTATSAEALENVLGAFDEQGQPLALLVVEAGRADQRISADALAAAWPHLTDLDHSLIKLTCSRRMAQQ